MSLTTVVEVNSTSDFEDPFLGLNLSTGAHSLPPSSIAKCERLVASVVLFTRLPNYFAYFIFKFCVNILGALGALLVIAVYWNRAKKYQRFFQSFKNFLTVAIFTFSIRKSTSTWFNTFCRQEITWRKSSIQYVDFSNSAWTLICTALPAFFTVVVNPNRLHQTTKIRVKPQLFAYFQLKCSSLFGFPVWWHHQNFFSILV